MTKTKTPEEMLAEAKAIAARLKRADKVAYKNLFSCLNARIRYSVRASEILRVVNALEREFERGHKPRDLRKYLHGARRSIRLEREAGEFRQRRGAIDRAQGETKVGEILDGVLPGVKP